MRFTFPHSHAFPGGRVAVAADDDGGGDDGGGDDGGGDDGGGDGPAATVEFAGGVTLAGAFRRDGAELVLDVPAHRTARGTAIAARRWRLRRRGDGTWRSHPD